MDTDRTGAETPSDPELSAREAQWSTVSLKANMLTAELLLTVLFLYFIN